MKLKKLLLPIASVASTAAIVAPIVTSCGSKTLKWEFTLSNDGLTKYESKYDQYETTGKTFQEVEKAYFDDLTKNKNIFADDLLCGLSALWQDDAWWDYEELEGSVTVQVTKFDKDERRLSYKLINDFNFETSSVLEAGSYKGRTISTVEVKDVKMALTYNILGTDYYLAPNGLTGDQVEAYTLDPTGAIGDTIAGIVATRLKADDKWSIDWTLERQVAGVTHTHSIHWNKENVDREFTGYNIYESIVIDADPTASQALCAWAYYTAAPHHLKVAA